MRRGRQHWGGLEVCRGGLRGVLCLCSLEWGTSRWGGATLVSEQLTIVIVLLFADAQGGERDVNVGDIVNVVEAGAS